MRLTIFALVAAVEAFEFAPLSKVAQTAVKAAAPALIAGALVAGSAMPALAAADNKEDKQQQALLASLSSA